MDRTRAPFDPNRVVTKEGREFDGAVRDPVSGQVIGCAIEVHRLLGPGLLESAYEECLSYELRVAGLHIERQVAVPVTYKGVNLDATYRLDLVVERTLLVELKAVEAVLPVHKAQVLTYLRLSGLRTGLLMNFCAARLRDGVTRLVL